VKLRRASNSAGVTLGQLLGRGGEGSVHVVTAAPTLVAKIYKKPPSAAKADKLRAMVRCQSGDLLRVAAAEAVAGR
jgi:DNA-binding helix-hairpin-helix protein with protein kinase domain